MKLTRNELLKWVDYNKETGVFTWRERTEEIAPDENGRRSFNSQYAGKPAGTIDRTSGNIRIMIAGKNRYAKNMAWLAVKGKIPARIEHRDGDRSNIKWDNLATAQTLQAERKAEQAATEANFSPEVRPGVVYYGYKGAYRAFVNLAFVTIVVGHYKTLEAATEARNNKLIEMGIAA